MTPQEWKIFFDLMGDVVNLPGKTYLDKAASVRAHAKDCGDKAEGNLEEFLSWFPED